jgi:peptidoglycan/xylan/chitin deacetylase (PgdA/CDA1 family)
MFRPLVRNVLFAVIAALTALPSRAGPRTVYLTFDADMTPAMLRRLHAGEVESWYDPGIVDFLRAQHVPAAIFVSGLFAEAYPDLVQGLAHDPLFTVGVHGYRHSAYTPDCYGLPVLHSEAEKREDVTHARDAIAKVSGRVPTLFRYPGLCHDAQADKVVRQAGLRVDTPNVIAGDSFNSNVKAIVEQVLKQTKNRGTVIFHLGGPNAPATLAALKQVVPALAKRGYVFAGK